MKYDLFLIILIVILLIDDFTILANHIAIAYMFSNIIYAIGLKMKGRK